MDVAMVCSSGQVDINHASIGQLMSALRVSRPVAERVVSARPYLQPSDVLVVEGIGAGALNRILSARTACATPTTTPPPAIRPCTDGRVDLQSATVQELSESLRLSRPNAQRIVDARPFASPAHVTPERVPGIGKGQLAALVEASCLTPMPVRTAETSWRWAYQSHTTVISRGDYRLTVPPGVLDQAGAWGSVTPLASSGIPLEGPTADFTIHGPWADGQQTVDVTLPVDPELASLADDGFEPVTINHARDDLEVYPPALTRLSADGRVQTVSVAGLSKKTSSLLHRSLLVPLTRPTVVNPRKSLLNELVREFTGIRADQPSCAPDLTNHTRVHTAGDVFEKNELLGRATMRFCVTQGEGSAEGRWKLANNSGAVLHVNTQGEARQVNLYPTGDLLTDISYDVWNDMTGVPEDSSRVRVDVPPGGTVWVDLPEGSRADDVEITQSTFLSLSSFVVRRIDKILPDSEVRTVYTKILNTCGYALGLNPQRLVGWLNCAMEHADDVVTVKALSNLLFVAEGALVAGDVFGTAVSGAQHAYLTYHQAVVLPPVGGGGGSGGSGQGVDGSLPAPGRQITNAIVKIPGYHAQATFRGDGIGYAILDTSTYTCLAQRYPVRDWLPDNQILLVVPQVSQSPATCNRADPVFTLPQGSRNWILRQPDGTAWLLDANGERRWIQDEPTYICLAQKYWVADARTWDQVSAFAGAADGQHASCS
ncbi:hypothetical protein [Blastococcus montanus]|uniref:hypothetical protein n=1 Tax=Blastococcus montanus TaxID=3144973 RepID=UPI003209777E